MTKLVQFRVDEKVYEALENRAKELSSSVNECAKSLTMDSLFKETVEERDTLADEYQNTSNELFYIDSLHVDRIIEKLKNKGYTDQLIKQMFEQFRDQVDTMPKFSKRRVDWDA